MEEARNEDQEAVGDQAPEHAAGGTSGATQANIELLMDIPLSIQVRLGETRLPLREVLSLSPGATLRLNRSDREPVELYVNGKLIGTGQVIQTPEGNVGVEVSSIVTRAERLRRFA